MKTIIYYFSATGNSLALARKIADGLGETELISIPQAMKGSMKASAPRIGFVFPVYAFGLPRIVADFIKGLSFQDNPYIFAVATCGGTHAGTLLQLKNLLQKRRARLSAGFAVRENGYALLSKDNPVISFVRNLNGQPPEFANQRLADIITATKGCTEHPPETGSAAAVFFGDLIHRMGVSVFKTADKDYRVDEHCTHCETCVRVCPRNNIVMIDAKPIWQHDCELCFACLQWCPNSAIQYQDSTREQKRSHHPEIAIDDMLVR